MAEANLRRALAISGNDFSILVRRPIAAVLLILAGLSLVLAIKGHQKIEAKMAELEENFVKTVGD